MPSTLNNNLINLKEFEGLSDQEKELTLKILGELSSQGQSSIFNNIKFADFEETPVDIHTFLHDKRYLGNALYDQEGRFTLFPYWEQKLKEIFPTPTETKFNTVVLTGAIGLGKSTVAVICLLYMLYRLLNLKDPYLYYGMQPIDKLTISLMNITLENAKGVAMDKLNQMILSSEWFMAHGEMAGTTNLEYRPQKHIEVIAASSNNQVIGRALFCLDGTTPIVTTEGIRTLQDIADSKDVVQVYQTDGKNICISDFCTVEKTVETTEEIELVLEDGTAVKCTPNHRFRLASGEYKRADQLTEDDDVMEVSIE